MSIFMKIRPVGADNTHNRRTPMPPAGFEPTISADEKILIPTNNLVYTIN